MQNMRRVGDTIGITDTIATMTRTVIDISGEETRETRMMIGDLAIRAGESITEERILEAVPRMKRRRYDRGLTSLR